MKKPTRILFPTGSFYPAQNGGPDNTVYWITKALKRRGYDTVISSTDWGQPETTKINEWIDTDFGKVVYAKDLIHYLPLVSLKYMLSQIKNADIVHLTMITYPSSFITAILNSRFYGKPMVWSSRGDLDPPMLLRSRRVKALAIWMINTFVRKDLLLFHSTCKEETSYIQDNFGDDVNVVEIPNYMELPEKLSLPNDDYLLFVGRIDPKKGLENLFRGLAQSKVFMSNRTVLKVVGDHRHTYGKSLEELANELGIANRIEFLGHVTGYDKEVLLAAAKCLIMPSHTENFGIVVTEALAQGTPAIASTGTPWSSLDETGSGYWVDNDPTSLEGAIDRILSLPEEELHRMGQNALTLVTTAFDIHNNVDEWEEAYAEALALKVKT